MRRNNRRRVKLNPRAPLVIIFFMIIIVITVIAIMYFIYVKDDVNRLDTLRVDFNQTSDTLNSNQSGSKIESTPSAPSSDTTNSDNTSGGDTTSEPPTPPADFDPLSTIVGESKSVDKAYFDDAVFVGDSISKGLKIYGVLPAANVIADQNVGIPTIAANNPAYMNTAGKKITLDEALNAVPIKPTKVYVMLGLNGLPHYTNEEHIPYYYKVVQYLKKKYPNATIYIQSVTPITAKAESDYAKRKQDFTNKKILAFNELVKQMCIDEKLYYLNVRDVLVDGKGELKAELASTDGFHFIKAGHEAMYQYYKTHTVPKYLTAPDE